MTAPGEKASLINMLDSSMSDAASLQSIYKIEILFSRSENKGVLCGAICVFRNNSIDLAVNPMTSDVKKLQEMKEDLSKQTEVMYQDPILFREDKGQWIDWAITKALEIYDNLGGADIIVKAPRLKIKERRSSGTVSAHRSDVDSLFTCLRDIDQLLRGGYQWDPWTRTVRRGEINAKKGGR